MAASPHDLALAALEAADALLNTHGIDDEAAIDGAWALRHIADAAMHLDQLRPVSA